MGPWLAGILMIDSFVCQCVCVWILCVDNKYVCMFVYNDCLEENGREHGRFGWSMGALDVGGGRERGEGEGGRGWLRVCCVLRVV